MHVLYKTYSGSADKIMMGSIREVFIYYSKALEEKEDDRLYHLWTNLVPHMTIESFVSFNEYKQNIFDKPSNKSNSNSNSMSNIVESNKSEEEVLQDAKNILKMDIGRVHQIEVKI